MTVYYWQRGHKKNYHAKDMQEAVDIKLDLRKRLGPSFHGVSWFHYYDEEERHWL